MSEHVEQRRGITQDKRERIQEPRKLYYFISVFICYLRKCLMADADCLPLYDNNNGPKMTGNLVKNKNNQFKLIIAQVKV